MSIGAAFLFDFFSFFRYNINMEGLEKPQSADTHKRGGERLSELEFYKNNSKEALHQKLREYIRRRLFSARREIFSSGNKLLFRATALDELVSVGEIIEDVERRLVGQEHAKHPDVEHILARVPETALDENGLSLKDAFRTFLGDYYEERNELEYFLREHAPPYTYETIVGHPPKGAIWQERVLDSVAWIFEEESDCRDYYASERGNTDEARSAAQEMVGEVSAHIIDGKIIRIVTYPKVPIKATEVHETRHVIFDASTLPEAPIDKKFEESSAQNEKELAKLLETRWGERLKNELIAYLREALEGDERHVALAYLINFGESGLYNYPKQNKEEAEKIYDGIPGASEDFEEYYKKITKSYYAFANETVGRVAGEFNEIAYKSSIVYDEGYEGPREDDPNNRLDADVIISEKEDKNRIRALRVLEFYPIEEWPKLLDNLGEFLEFSENDLSGEISSWEWAVEKENLKTKDKRLLRLFEERVCESESLKRFFENIRKKGKNTVSAVEEEKIMRIAEELEAGREEVLTASLHSTQIWEEIIAELSEEGTSRSHSRVSRAIGVAKLILDMKEEWAREVAPLIRKHAVKTEKFLKKLFILSEKFGEPLEGHV
ncbi:MAG: hypothetical protein A3D57_05480 [Candidatus Sungbacteria bacterium RIFCSPHIGHO2_02_FULL_46_12]|nr:MAG: hypothetical protein A3D57_05480 [Candidatus Sungbacteria bacterium RIFCSPHIGHO2_02_FULL_46_12]